MSETNKSYRIRTNVGEDDQLYISTNLLQDYDSFDILSVSISTTDVYRLHNSKCGVIVGRVLANNGFGVPNAKISVFISSDEFSEDDLYAVYPFMTTSDRDNNGVRYNLLPDEKVGDCHQIVGTFPNKRYLLDNDVLLEVFDKYYKYTTRTNNSGDYILVGIPTGNHILHMDLDLSDCGILSQRPRDFVYKGYTIEQFENPNMFKSGTEYSTLSQVFTQDQTVNVKPFWGDANSGEEIGITRADINIAFKFEPTCVFLGCVASDNSSQGIAKSCVPTPHMGDMDELTTGEGKIEMIRKTPGGDTEEFQIKGTQLIDGNGIWCYQIPMNLDYMMTDEYGNMVPTDNPEKGIPTRARVRFRLSMQDNEQNTDNYFRPKVLIPHNPQNNADSGHEDYDYEFGTMTRDDSFRDLFWNNVYSVKSYIPRFQKRGSSRGWKEDRFTGIKGCNFYGSNNPIPYNNIRIKMPFMFKIMCLIVKVMILAISIVNTVKYYIFRVLGNLSETLYGTKLSSLLAPVTSRLTKPVARAIMDRLKGYRFSVIEDGLCPDLENWYFAPLLLKKGMGDDSGLKFYYHLTNRSANILSQTLESILKKDYEGDTINNAALRDEKSIDYENRDTDDEIQCITIHTDYLLACIEMNLAMEYKVIKFNFYNDWINGLIYIPRFMRYIRPKKKFLGITVAKSKVRGCMDDTKIFAKTRRYTQQCAIGYDKNNPIEVISNVSINTKDDKKKAYNKYHKKGGFRQYVIFGKNGGICHEHTTSKKQFVYYLKPCEWDNKTTGSTSSLIINNKKINLFATDIILLGSLNSCDQNGLPQAFKYLSNSSYIMPSNLALTNMETNGPLYATEKGTMCMGSGMTWGSDVSRPIPVDNMDVTTYEGLSDLMPPIKDLADNPTNSALTQELLYLSSSTSDNDRVVFESDELSDYIPMTIAAGISWNYTGPGQGKKNAEKLYYPGGHFLGISCKNSQTNIKSCINLERICEVGSTMSERKEDVIGWGSNGELIYAYSSPTGFISGEELINTDFRTMFSTMNNGRLIANKINPNTGYRIYDFNYYRPSNFDGAFEKVASENADVYNASMSRYTSDESASLHRYFNIALSSNSGRTDHDPNEVLKSQNRTRESANLDYYLFRFGLNHSNYKNVQDRSFLFNKDGKYYLPQYENSFYFYFGMREGATALDEFNKQFFSVCDSTSLIGTEVNMTLEQEIDVCNAVGTIVVNTENLKTPYEKITLTYFVNGTETVKDFTSLYNNHVQFRIPNQEFRDYTVYIKDGNGIELTKTISLGENLISCESEVYDFNVEGDAIPRMIYRGGYIEVSNVSINRFEDELNLCRLIVKNANGTQTDSATIELDSSTANQLYVDNEGAHTLYLQYRCVGNSKINTLPIMDFSIGGPASIDIRIGDPNRINYSIKDKIGYSGVTQWYENIGNSASTEAWCYRISLFNGVNNAEKVAGSRTHSCRVYVDGGEKTIWGYPQSYDNGYFMTMLCRDKDVIPPGYALDDDAHYYSTYGVSGNVRDFCALPHNGPYISGRNYGLVTGGTMEISDADKTHYKDGYGYSYRSVIPDSDPEYYVLNGEDYQYGSGSTLGLFFPTVIYPAMERPFFADMNFFVWHDISIEIETEGEYANAFEEEAVKGTHIEGVVHNGVTFENRFGTDTRLDDRLTVLRTTKPDTQGLTRNSSVDRLTIINDDVATVDVEGGSYHIQEGHPVDSNARLMTSYIEDTIEVGFYTNFSHELRNGKVIVRRYGDAGGADATYYLCLQGGDDEIKFIDNDKQCIGERHEYKDDQGNVHIDYYVYCLDEYGNPYVARIWPTDNPGIWYVTYNEQTSTMTASTMVVDEMFYDDYVVLLQPFGLRPRRKRYIIEHPTINNIEVTWEEAINASIQEEVVLGTWSQGTNYNEDDFFVIGVFEQTPTNNPDGKTKLYKVYPYLIYGNVQ